MMLLCICTENQPRQLNPFMPVSFQNGSTILQISPDQTHLLDDIWLRNVNLKLLENAFGQYKWVDQILFSVAKISQAVLLKF